VARAPGQRDRAAHVAVAAVDECHAGRLAQADGPDAWSAVFALGPARGEAPNEYLPGLPAIGYGPRFFLDRFAELVPSQTVNVAGHPPGPLLLVDALGIRTHGPLAALCIGAGALSAPATYTMSRALGPGEREARVAGVLVAFSPVALLFGARDRSSGSRAPCRTAGTGSSRSARAARSGTGECAHAGAR